jgi:ectoine hydroxylase-related dioxygenase (phytanoyl-CoA dioxygenase family)
MRRVSTPRATPSAKIRGTLDRAASVRCQASATGRAERERAQRPATSGKRRVPMLTRQQVESYRRDGYLMIESVLDARELATLRQVTDDLVAASRAVTQHNDIYDLEPTHSTREPRVRRIKEPHNAHPAYREIAFSKKIAAMLEPLLGSSGVRFQTGKLNMKAAGYGAAVEWHQDWAFYPHTNDDLLAIGLYLDDCGPDNGPLMVIPGSHTGPIADHHSSGVFCGAIDPASSDIDFSKAVMLTGPAGSMTIHHVRMVHGSALNTSGRPRRLLLYQYTAVDAFPLLGIPSWEKFNDNIVTGQPTMVPRLTSVPVRIPLPAAPFEGSIYENQRTLANRFFEVFQEEQVTNPATR